MSPANTILQARDTELEAITTAQSAASLALPDEIAARYRVVEIGSAGASSIGLYRGAGATEPAIEIDGTTIKAAAEDKQTIADLIAIARHQGWSKLQVAGTDEFRRAIWDEANLQGLEVEGYAPSFAERARLQSKLEAKAPSAEPASPALSTDPANATAQINAARAQALADEQVPERPDLAREAVTELAERERIGIVLQTAVRELEAIRDPHAAVLREDLVELLSGVEERRRTEPPGGAASLDRSGSEAAEELAGKFLAGSPEAIASDPRLVEAARAQTAMERHIEVLFDGDIAAITAANLESRQLIAGVLARGLDVGVRRQIPERAIEPVRADELER